MSDHEDVVKRSDKLDEIIATSPPDIAALARASQRNRTFIRILAVSLVADMLLTLGVIALAWRDNQLFAQTTSIRQQQHLTCLASNESRAGQRQLWHHVLDLPPAQPRTAEQQQQADDFGRYVDDVFAPRKC